MGIIIGIAILLLPFAFLGFVHSGKRNKPTDKEKKEMNRTKKTITDYANQWLDV